MRNGSSATPRSIRGRVGAMILRGTILLGVTGLPVGVALGAGSTAAAASPNVVEVRMHEFKFCADAACTQDSTAGGVVTIHPGDTVKWVWDEASADPMPNCDSPFFQLPLPVSCPGHTTTATDKTSAGKPLWDSGTCAAPDGHAAPGSAGCPFSVTFDKPGSFSYFCVYHGGANANNPITKMNGLVVVQGSPATRDAAGASAGGSGVSGANSAGSALPNTGTEPQAAVSGFRDVLLVGVALYVVTAIGAGLALSPRR
jgi:plastocyanin